MMNLEADAIRAVVFHKSEKRSCPETIIDYSAK